ncbi:hypothetical protein [Paraburkholderia sacchari]|uniref:Uncharacterized protein n=1 Tax=Paraburkholderia sacchari TaxID=159450 RepID=A0A8T6Z358_9BURK|nr:hypothetical protein [Paraburkholderia sacchari]NLP59616.1 hypothetical protein [Paraburkholderia sacchari]
MNTGRAARSASSRRRSPAPSADTDAAQPADAQAGAPMLDLFDKETEPALEHEAAGAAYDSQAAPAHEKAAEPTADAVSADGKPNDSGDPVTARAQDEAPEPAVAAGTDAPEPHEPAGTQASAVPASDLTDTQRQGEAMATIVALAATQADASPQPATPAAPKQPEPSPEPSPEPLAGALASGHSYAPTSATGNTARMISAVHAADVGPVVHSQAPERATAALPAEIVAAISAQTAAQTRRTKWMLSAAVAALVVTAGVAIAQTLLLASLSADATAQQQRLDVLMQNQQTALDNLASRLAALTAVAPAAAATAPATAPTGAAREPESPTPPRRPERTAKTQKSTEKTAAHTAGSKSSRTHTQSATRQAAAKN